MSELNTEKILKPVIKEMLIALEKLPDLVILAIKTFGENNQIKIEDGFKDKDEIKAFTNYTKEEKAKLILKRFKDVFELEFVKIYEENNLSYFFNSRLKKEKNNLAKLKRRLLQKHENILNPAEGSIFLDEKELEIQEKLNNWKKTGKYCCEYPFISIETEFNKLKWVEKDLLLFMLYFIDENYKDGLQNSVVPKLKSHIGVPIISIGKIENSKAARAVVKDNIFENETHIIEVVSHNNRKSLYDEVDSDIVSFLLSEYVKDGYNKALKKEQFKGSEEMYVIANLGDLAEVAYASRGKKQRELTKKRLVEMTDIKFKVISKETSKLKEVFGIVYEVDELEDGKLKILLTPKLFNQTQKEQFIYVYKEEINRLENPICKQLAFIFQEERIRIFRNNKSWQQIWSLNDFSGKVFFNSKNKKNIIKMLKESLNELKENGIIVKDYESLGYEFRILFEPLTKEDIVEYYEPFFVKSISGENTLQELFPIKQEDLNRKQET